MIKMKQRLASVGVLLTMATMPSMAFAAATPIEGALDFLLDLLTNGLARTAAILAIVVLGYLAWVGKLAVEMVGKFILGIVLIFGGAALVDLIIAAAS